MTAPSPETRVCCHCRVAKPLDNCGRDKTRKDGINPTCRGCKTLAVLVWRQKDKARHNASAAAWRKANPEAAGAIRRRSHNKNKPARNAACRKWRQENKPLDAAHSAARRANRKRATPAWASHGYIALFYLLAAEESRRTGREVHVDHIVPLNSPDVCGLHVEHNLQLLFKEDNLAKGNRFTDGRARV